MRDKDIDDILNRAAGTPPDVDPALLGSIANSLGASLRPVRPLPFGPVAFGCQPIRGRGWLGGIGRVLLPPCRLPLQICDLLFGILDLLFAFGYLPAEILVLS
jgi:hypothetical protein